MSDEYLTLCDDCEHALRDDEEEDAFAAAEFHRRESGHEVMVVSGEGTREDETLYETVKRLYDDGLNVAYQLAERGEEPKRVRGEGEFGGAV
jgi:hypothetical protein